MSIPVDLADLARTLEEAGTGYLLSTTGGRIKAVTVEPDLLDGALVLRSPGRGSLANLVANPAVTLLFSPAEPRGYTLLVDGHATVEGDDVRVAPDHAVLHRPAHHADEADQADQAHQAHQAGAGAGSACGHDCHPVA